MRNSPRQKGPPPRRAASSAVLLGRDGGDLPSDAIGATQLPPTERIRAEWPRDTVARPAEARADVRAATERRRGARRRASRQGSAVAPPQRLRAL